MRMLGRAFRKLVFCSRGIHCRMVYDSGLPNDIGRAGTCTDCGYATTKWRPVSWIEV
jgi:hypothetical protein